MARKVMTSCAVTGSADTPARNPAVPVTPDQIANSCLDAAKAGAAIVHIHVRDPKTTKPSMKKALYRETVERIRNKNNDVIINLTTGPGATSSARPVPGTPPGSAASLYARRSSCRARSRTAAGSTRRRVRWRRRTRTSTMSSSVWSCTAES